MQAHKSSAWSVSTLLRHVDDLLTETYPSVYVGAEITGFFRAASGHCYFQLKDSDGQVKCAMFRRSAMRLNFFPADGQRVLVLGRLGVYGPKGELQLVADSMVLEDSMGQQYAQFLRLRELLRGEGLFAAERKRALEAIPRCVAVVTSEDAAALADVCRAIARRAPHVQLVLFPCQVQGAGAAFSIVEALKAAAQWRSNRGDSVQTTLLVRGGGAWEDLVAFNDEHVVRAIVASPVPVVCGVGHETDLTLADLAADVRAATPTAAAELCASPRDELLERLQAARQRMGNAGQRRIETSARRVDELAARMPRCATSLHLLRARTLAGQQRLQYAMDKSCVGTEHVLSTVDALFQQAVRRLLDKNQWQLGVLGTRLDSGSPQRVLQRGFAYLERKGSVVASAKAVHPGDRIRAILSDGVVEMQVVSACANAILE